MGEEKTPNLNSEEDWKITKGAFINGISLPSLNSEEDWKVYVVFDKNLKPILLNSEEDWKFISSISSFSSKLSLKLRRGLKEAD